MSQDWLNQSQFIPDEVYNNDRESDEDYEIGASQIPISRRKAKKQLQKKQKKRVSIADDAKTPARISEQNTEQNASMMLTPATSSRPISSVLDSVKRPSLQTPTRPSMMTPGKSPRVSGLQRSATPGKSLRRSKSPVVRRKLGSSSSFGKATKTLTEIFSSESSGSRNGSSLKIEQANANIQVKDDTLNSTARQNSSLGENKSRAPKLLEPNSIYSESAFSLKHDTITERMPSFTDDFSYSQLAINTPIRPTFNEIPSSSPYVSPLRTSDPELQAELDKLEHELNVKSETAKRYQNLFTVDAQDMSVLELADPRSSLSGFPNHILAPASASASMLSLDSFEPLESHEMSESANFELELDKLQANDSQYDGTISSERSGPEPEDRQKEGVKDELESVTAAKRKLSLLSSESFIAIPKRARRTRQVFTESIESITGNKSTKSISKQSLTFENSDNTFQKPVGALYSIAEATPHSSKSDTLIIPGTPRHGRQLADKEMSLIEENLLLQSKSSFRDISPMQSESIKRAESCDDTQDNVSMVATRSIKGKTQSEVLDSIPHKDNQNVEIPSTKLQSKSDASGSKSEKNVDSSNDTQVLIKREPSESYCLPGTVSIAAKSHESSNWDVAIKKEKEDYVPIKIEVNGRGISKNSKARRLARRDAKLDSTSKVNNDVIGEAPRARKDRLFRNKPSSTNQSVRIKKEPSISMASCFKLQAETASRITSTDNMIDRDEDMFGLEQEQFGNNNVGVFGDIYKRGFTDEDESYSETEESSEESEFLCGQRDPYGNESEEEEKDGKVEEDVESKEKSQGVHSWVNSFHHPQDEYEGKSNSNPSNPSNESRLPEPWFIDNKRQTRKGSSPLKSRTNSDASQERSLSRPTGQLVDGQSVENSDEDAGASQQEVLSSGTCYVTPSPGVLVPPTQLPINGGGGSNRFSVVSSSSITNPAVAFRGAQNSSLSNEIEATQRSLHSILEFPSSQLESQAQEARTNVTKNARARNSIKSASTILDASPYSSSSSLAGSTLPNRKKQQYPKKRRWRFYQAQSQNDDNSNNSGDDGDDDDNNNNDDNDNSQGISSHELDSQDLELGSGTMSKVPSTQYFMRNILTDTMMESMPLPDYDEEDE